MKKNEKPKIYAEIINKIDDENCEIKTCIKGTELEVVACLIRLIKTLSEDMEENKIITAVTIGLNLQEINQNAIKEAAKELQEQIQKEFDFLNEIDELNLRDIFEESEAEE